ncbi:MAG: hypothetical protein M0010_04540 [Actinomycetota bacterium]|nr:hypothetical protein [Actinomycetota bacterium]
MRETPTPGRVRRRCLIPSIRGRVGIHVARRPGRRFHPEIGCWRRHIVRTGLGIGHARLLGDWFFVVGIDHCSVVGIDHCSVVGIDHVSVVGIDHCSVVGRCDENGSSFCEVRVQRCSCTGFFAPRGSGVRVAAPFAVIDDHHRGFIHIRFHRLGRRPVMLAASAPDDPHRRAGPDLRENR